MAEAAKKVDPKAAGNTPPAETKPKKDWMGVVLVFLVTTNLVAVGAMGFLLKNLWQKMKDVSTQPPKVVEAPAAPDTVGKELQAPSLGVLYPMETFLVNINSDQGTKYLQAQMELELSDPALEDEISRKKAALRDSIIVLLTSRTYKELREANGIKKLRSDLTKVLNGLLSTGKVKEIYFTQFHFN
jgi:flagellar protein FliL